MLVFDETSGEWVDDGGDTAYYDTPADTGLDTPPADSGNQTYQYDDGSSLTVDSSGNVVSYTPATDGTPIDGGILSSLTQWVNRTMGTSLTPKQVAGAGLGGLAGLKSYMDASNYQAPKTGYQGGIPQYAGIRAAVAPDRPAGYRPGQGGQRYFTDMQYVAPSAAPAAQAAAQQQAEQLRQQNVQAPVQAMAEGGVAGRYLRGHTDGMADEIDTSIDDETPAKLSHGEFVIPADVVSHLGNGNSDAGAKKLYEMMDRVRHARTGTKKQGKEINPDRFMPGGLASSRRADVSDATVKRYAEGGATPTATAISSGMTGTESNLSNWAGPYVTNMLGKGQALSEQPFAAYGGPLTAGSSTLQNTAFTNAGNLTMPTVGAFTPGSFTDPGVAGKYMNPYLQQALEPQLAEARRQAEISRLGDAARLTKAGAFGGSRQAIMEAEGNRNLGTNLANITGAGYRNAYDKGAAQFNTEQNLGLQASTAGSRLGLDILNKQAELGGSQRGIESEGIAADKAAFEEERDRPYKMVQYQQSLLQGLPLAAQQYNMTAPNPLITGTQMFKSIYDLLNSSTS